ncbi:MAG: hypothetical protein U0Y68_24265 [Blastocatellia bacterium]
MQGDFNGDSRPDIAAINKGDAVTMLAAQAVYSNSGSGNFGSATNFNAGTTPEGLRGNFDNDSNVDGGR